MNTYAQALVKSHEGCKFQSYKDLGGLWTIGWGSTGPDIIGGMTWTQEQCDARLSFDIGRVEVAVRKSLRRTLSDMSVGALLDFAYNLGSGALASSHLLQCVNSGDDVGAAKQFIVWDHVGTDEVKGLLIRRLEEAVLYLKGV